jgi:hypothetical protein
MAAVQTFTSTTTFARTDLIKTQFRFLVAETVDLSEEEMKKFIDDGIDGQWLGKLIIYAVDSNNKCIGQMTLEINQDIHKQEIILNQKVVLNRPWRGEDNNISPGVFTVVSDFNNKMEQKGIKTIIWRLCYAPGVNGEEMNRQLGLNWAKPPEWKTSPSGERQVLTRLPEVVMGYCYAGQSANAT